MYRNILFLIYAIILCLSFFWNIKIYNYPLQTYLVVISLLIGLLIYRRSFNDILFHSQYIYLRYFILYYLSLIAILVIHDLINHKTNGILKALSMLIYLFYSIVLVHVLKNRKTLTLTLKLFLGVLIIYSLGYIFNFKFGEQIKFFIFDNRTNLAWFLLFLHVLTFDHLSRKMSIMQASLIFGLLLINSSRSPIIVFLIISSYYYRDVFKNKKDYLLKLIGIPLLVIVFYSLSDYFTLAIERLKNITNLDYNSSTGYRISVIIDSFIFALDNFMGHGYASFVDIFGEISALDLSTKEGEFSADNSFMEILIDTGWIPFAFLLLFIYKMFKSDEYNKIFCFTLATLMLFDSIVYNNFWTLLIISALIINANRPILMKKII